MSERNETVVTADGKMDLFITYPDDRTRTYPVIVQLMDGLGMREELREHARRTASWGYYVVTPDLFYRAGLKGPLDFSAEGARDRIMAAIGDLTVKRATSDIEMALKLIEDDPAASTDKIGLYGFCMGGKLSLDLAQALDGRVAAGAAIHPGNLSTESPDSPHRHLDRVSAELYFGIADKDAMATPEQMADLEEQLRAKDITYQLEWHPGALHGFMMPSRAELYNEKAAETVWTRMKALFDRNLG